MALTGKLTTQIDRSSTFSLTDLANQYSSSTVVASMESNASPCSEGLTFLVTHWLANFNGGGTSNVENEERRRALERIRNASAEIASAFSSLGAFGTTIPVSEW